MSFLSASLLKPLIGPTVSWLGGRKSIRRVRARVTRGKRSFAIPKGMMYVLVPARPDGKGGFVPSDQERAACDIVEAMLASLGYHKDKEWKEHRLRPSEPVPDEVRRANIFVLGEAGAGGFISELLSSGELSGIRHGTTRHRAWFGWNNARFESGHAHDVALLASVPNPYNQDARAVLLLGLRGLGTLGAAKVFADRNYQGKRKELETLGDLAGGLALLLHVTAAAANNDVADVRVAEAGDAVSSQPEQEMLDVIQTVSDSIERYHRQIGFSRLSYTFTVKTNYDLLVEEEVTFVATSKDILAFNKPYSESVPGKPIPDLGFSLSLLEPRDSESVTYTSFESDSSKRTYVVFPIPPIETGSSRRFRFSVLWPAGVQRLNAQHGDELIAVQVSPKAETNVDVVSVRIRFEDPAAVFLVEPLPNPHADTARQFRIHEPFEENFTNVAAGTQLMFRVVRIK